jgi:hypothetical protein
MTSLKPNLFRLLVFIVSLLGRGSAEDLSFLDGDLSATCCRNEQEVYSERYPHYCRLPEGDLPRQKL